MRLGSEGGEAVNFVINDYPRGLITALPEYNREIQCKRPTQNYEPLKEVPSETESEGVAKWISEIIGRRGRPIQGGE
jgi:hypothetical protein